MHQDGELRVMRKIEIKRLSVFYTSQIDFARRKDDERKSEPSRFFVNILLFPRDHVHSGRDGVN